MDSKTNGPVTVYTKAITQMEIIIIMPLLYINK